MQCVPRNSYSQTMYKPNFLFFSIKIQKMKTIVLFLSLFLYAQAGLMSLKTCQDQYVPDINNICIRPNYIQGCLLYKNVDQCDKCSNDYELTDGICLVPYGISSTALIGCLIDDGSSCSNCANGFKNVDGVCQKAVKFCSDYEGEACIRCESEYSLIFGECKHNLMLGCKSEQADHTCTDCFKPFELKNYQCVIPNCKSYNDFGCFSCECGYFINQDRSCRAMQPGCLKYYRGTCVECLAHYKLKGGVCDIEGCIESTEDQCTACKKEYDLVEGSCKFKDCVEWKDDSCLICNSGFSLQGDKCVKIGKYVCSE